jgi:PAS domain S-box-containing protein
VDFSLLESVPDAMVIVDRQGRIVFANGLAEQLFGYTRAELAGRPIEALIPLRFRDPHQGHRQGYTAASRARPMGLGLDLFGLRKDGVEFAAEISLSPFRDGDETYVMSAIRDVTERKRLEDRARLYRQAQEEVRERDEFLSIASHELRTPVTALQLQLQLFQRYADRAGVVLPREMHEKVEALERQIRRIALLVNELLDLSRLRLGKLELRREELDLAELAREIIANLQSEIDLSGSRVDLQVMGTAGAAGAAGTVTGAWDRLRLGQVLTNLLVNAVKFGQGKPISVTVERDGAGRALLEVRDQGIGIAPEHQARVFGRFERAVSAEHFGGLGLGLYIARQIVEAHGGEIRVESTPGDGSTFRVELPRTPARGPEVAASPT